jgi:lipopolysaccharide assembly outer membrane protein LptD (OstA)
MHIRKSRRKFAGPMYLAVSILTLIGWLDAHEILAQTGSGAIPRILKKGALCIEGNEVEGEGTSSYKATGFAVATIGGQSSKLEGDSIVYDKTTRTLEAKGHARLFRDGSETKAD